MLKRSELLEKQKFIGETCSDIESNTENWALSSEDDSSDVGNGYHHCVQEKVLGTK